VTDLHISLPALNPARTLANVLGRAAISAHQRGRDADAVKYVRQMVLLANAVDRQPTIVCHLVALGIEAMTADVAGLISPDLKVGAGGAPSSAVRELVDQLLDDRPARDGLLAAMRRERLMVGPTALAVYTGQFGHSQPLQPTLQQRAMLFLAKPLRYADERWALDRVTRRTDLLLRTKDFQSFVVAASSLGEAAEEESKPYLPVTNAATLSRDSLTRFMSMHYRCEADCRLAAVALAVRSYAVDHGGRLPGRLEDLETVYLPAVPVDPFARSGEKVRYRGTGDQPVIYSVGFNGVDDGGSDERRADAPKREYGPPDRWDFLDGSVHLTRRPRVRYPEPPAWRGQGPMRGMAPVPSMP